MAKSISNIRKKRIGRPPVNAVPILVRVPPAELKPIDAWIEKQGTFMSRPEAIRRLVELALKGRGKP
jgi:Arc/MetJ-type ribon-helix-helix transcriptional regulator